MAPAAVTSPLPLPGDVTLKPADDPSNIGSNYYPTTDSTTAFDPSDPSSTPIDHTATAPDPRGSTSTFMSMNTGAQIGIIVGSIVAALVLLGGLVAYWFKRKRDWEKEVVRRSMALGVRRQEFGSSEVAAGAADKEGATITTVESIPTKPRMSWWFGVNK